jgi:molybdate transport system substrate-binding protein
LSRNETVSFARRLSGTIYSGAIYIVAALYLGVALALTWSQAYAREEPAILVFAAASLSNVLEEIGDAYESQTGNKVIFSFAGSMTIARQISLSSGVDVFVSADLVSTDYLEQRGLILSSTRENLLQNELVLVAPEDSTTRLAITPGFALADALDGGRLALANSVSVPAGRYAKAALSSLGVWDEVSHLLAEAEDVRAALSFVARGEAPLGIVYATDAKIEPRVQIVARFPSNTHPPILYPVALTSDARPGAEEFLEYLKGRQARMLFENAGFATF